MTQRARLDQLKRSRSDIQYRTFLEQYEELERRAGHAHQPVATVGDLPTVGNKPGDECLVLDKGIKYYWDAGLQAWRPLLGKGYDVPTGLIKRHRGRIVAAGGETEIILSHRYDVGEDTLDVYINGILQDVDIDYLEIDESTIQFVTPLEQGMIITYMTPYVIGDAINDGEIQRRLLQIEHNHYQLMMVNYYQGKPVDSQSLFFDGFVNTQYIDYLKTTNNVEYDNVKQTMRVKLNTISKFQEVFDADTQIDMPVSSLRLANSEITLPISATLTTAFTDDFSTSSKMAMDATTAFWDPILQQIAVDPHYSGGNHYPLGDFMGTTGGVERAGGYWAVGQGGGALYSIAPSWAWTFFVQGGGYMSMHPSTRPYANTWVKSVCADPTSSYDHYNWHNGDQPWNGYSDNIVTLKTLTYVQAVDKFFAVRQTDDGGGKVTQTLLWINNRNTKDMVFATGYRYEARWGTWSAAPWPTGMPNTTGGVGKTDYVHSVSATKDHLLIRVEDIIFFVDPKTMAVVKTLDWSSAAEKPSRFLNNSMQFAADNRFLYFPWWGVYNEKNGYFVEVYDIQDGHFIDKYFITETYPTTTAMCYDFIRNRMMFGLWANNWYTLDNKGVAGNYSTNATLGGAMYFDPPSTNFVVAQSQPIYTNLSKVEYRLSATQVLNGGVIEYFIRFNGAAWQKIALGTTYTWDNPKKTDTAVIELRVSLKNNVGTVTSPIVTDWTLAIKQYLGKGKYVSKDQVLSLDKVTGGKLALNQTIPQESSLQWKIQLDPQAAAIPVAADGSFSTPSNLSTAQAIVTGEFATNNTLFSPVVRDYTLNMYYVNAARLESTIYAQMQDMTHATMWVTNTSSNDYVQPYLSRDGGMTWVEGQRESSVKLPDGSFESQYRFTFSGAEKIRNQAKVAFDLRGATEIVQYGVSLNPL